MQQTTETQTPEEIMFTSNRSFFDEGMIRKYKLDSAQSGFPVEYTSTKGERFVFENGQTVVYTDTRVIDHDTDRLVNLAEEPFED